MFATCKRGGFVLQRAITPVKELIAQNPPQDDLQTQRPRAWFLQGKQQQQMKQTATAGGSKQATGAGKQGS